MARMEKVEDYTPIAEAKKLKQTADLKKSRVNTLKAKYDEIAF